jgi:hypothetical protein
VTRWGRRTAPIAVEVTGGDRDATLAALLATARRRGRYESLVDERGARVHRVRLDPLPPLPRDGGDLVLEYAVLDQARRRRRAGVWVGGVLLPAALPWRTWMVLLAPLAAPGGSVSDRATVTRHP